MIGKHLFLFKEGWLYPSNFVLKIGTQNWAYDSQAEPHVFPIFANHCLPIARITLYKAGERGLLSFLGSYKAKYKLTGVPTYWSPI